VSALSGFVWSVADTLRGPYSESEYGSVILPFTVLRRLECVMEPHREVMAEVVAGYEREQQRRTHLKLKTRTADNPGLSFWTTSDYTLKKALQDPDNLAENLIDYVSGFSTNLDVFKSFDFENIIRTLDNRERLPQVTRHFEGIDLSPDAVSNADMGDLFENLIYRFAESANEGAGQFYTPRDVVRLLVDLVYADDADALRGRGTVRSIYDPTVGTGGDAQRRRRALAQLQPGRVDGAVRAGDQQAHLRDLQGRPADYWAGPVQRASGRYAHRRPIRGPQVRLCPVEPALRHRLEGSRVAGEGRACPRWPRAFRAWTSCCGRCGDALSPACCFEDARRRRNRPRWQGRHRLERLTAVQRGAGSGPSEIRGYMLENDLVEAIVALPNDMFYNTGIATYLWILSNAKPEDRKDTVQLIDATKLGAKLRKSIGSKRMEISDAHRDAIVRAFTGTLSEDDVEVPSKTFHKRDFAYWAVTVDRPLQLKFQCTSEAISTVAEQKTLAKVDGLTEALEAFGDEVYLNREKFDKELGRHLVDHGVRLTPAQRKKLWQTIGVRDDTADYCRVQSGKNKGELEPDPALRDTENVPFGWGDHSKTHEACEETVQEYFDVEVKPHVADAWIDWDKTKTGYEIPFTRHFYEYVPPRPLDEIDADLKRVVGEIMELLREVEG
jgi:type I restriction enzyme M protein